MTRRDFQLIARVLRANHAPLPLVTAMAAELRHTNPRFDTERFIRESQGGSSHV